MPSKQLVDLVCRLKNSGIKISFSSPRSKTMIHLQETEDEMLSLTGSSLCRKKNANHRVIGFIHAKSVRDAVIPH